MARHVTRWRKKKPGLETLNQRLADTVGQPREDGEEREIWDKYIPGFMLRIRKRSASWVYRGRLGKVQKTYTIGRSDDPERPDYVKAEEARKTADEIRSKLKRGIDPFPKAAAPEAAPPDELKPTFREAAELFLERLKRHGKLKSAETYRSVLLRIPEGEHLRDKPIAEVTAKDIQIFRDNLFHAGKMVQSNRCLTITSSLYKWCLTEPSLGVSVNPARGIGRIAPPEKPRERHLTTEEIRQFLAAIDAERYITESVRMALWLCLLTGQRKKSVITARKSDFRDGLWTIPAASTKSGRTHVVPLPDLAWAVVQRAMERSKSDTWLFPSKSHPNLPTHPSAFTRMLLRFEKRGLLDGIPDFTIHDLRRTLATRLADAGVPRFNVSRVLDHDSGERDGNVTARVYIHSLYLAEKREALEKWNSIIEPLRNWNDV